MLKKTIRVITKNPLKMLSTLVFIVDDEPLYLEMLKDSLSEDKRLDVKAFNTGQSCLDALHLNPEIVILDHTLDKDEDSEESGMEVLEKIKSQKPDTKVIVLSGQLYPDIMFDYIMKQDVVKYIVKGDNAFDELREEIDKLITT